MMLTRSSAFAGPALNRVLEKFANNAGLESAVSALDVLLAGVVRSRWSEVAWQFSELTGDGFPVELTFSSRDRDIRYTCEIAGPEEAAAHRLESAALVLESLGSPLPGDDFAFLQSVQRAGPLTWGAWVGGRHGLSTERYKIYVQVPDPYSAAAGLRIAELAGTRDLLESRATPLRMIGYEPANRRTEFYFKTEGMDSWEVVLLLRRFGLLDCQDALFELLSAAWGKPVREAMPAADIGFSLSSDSSGEVSFALHAYARSVFGGDCRIRRALLTLARQRNWTLAGYDEISAPLAARDDARTFHGVVSFGVGRGVGPALQVGLRPPEEPC
jgi:hypothetical protein